MIADAPISRSPVSLLRALTVQRRVVGALILRELHTRYGRENIGYLWMVAEPMMLATVIGLMHATGVTHVFASDIKPMPFAVLGYTVFILFRGIVNRSDGSLESNAPLLYHRMVTVMDITLSRAILEFAGVFLTYVTLSALMICLGFAQAPVRPLYLIGAWILMFWYSLGHSFIIVAASYENRTAGRFVHPYSYFMTGLSGAFYQMYWLPHPFRDWLEWLPTTSIFEMARYGQFYSTDLKYFHGQYVVGFCLLLTLIGLMMLRSLRHKIHIG